MNSEHKDFLAFAGKMRRSVFVRATVFEVLTVCLYTYLCITRPEGRSFDVKMWTIFLSYVIATPCIIALAEYTKYRYIKAHRFLAECFQAQHIPKGWRRYLFQCFEKHDAQDKSLFKVTPVLYKLINAYEAMESL